MRELIWLLVAMSIGAVGAYVLLVPDPIEYPEVIVPTARIIEREPDTIRTFIDRITTVAVEPSQVAIAPGGASTQVQEFCKPIVVAHTDTVDSGATVDPMLLIRSVSYDRRWAWRRDHLLLTGPTNEGDLKSLDFELRGDWTARTVGENALVQYPRSSLIYDTWEGLSQVVTIGVGLHLLYGILK